MCKELYGQVRCYFSTVTLANYLPKFIYLSQMSSDN